MTSDLASRIRDVVDSADPVTADEVLLRSALVGKGTLLGSPVGAAPFRRALLRPVGIAAVVLLVVGAGLAWRATSSSQKPNSNSATQGSVQVVLTAKEVSAIAASSTTAMARSGIAQVQESTSRNGVEQSSESIAVTFDGSNLDEKITVHDEQPGPPDSFTTDDRVVDGQFYIYTPGPTDVPEWLHDTGDDNNSSMSFPDPRTLYRSLDPGADFTIIGVTNAAGVSLTHLSALEPGAISSSSLENIESGPLTSFDLWVDQNDVVQKMSLASSEATRECLFELPDGGKQLRPAGKAAIAFKKASGAKGFAIEPAASGTASSCGPVTNTSTTAIDFAGLGDPQSIVAPPGAVEAVGKG